MRLELKAADHHGAVPVAYRDIDRLIVRLGYCESPAGAVWDRDINAGQCPGDAVATPTARASLRELGVTLRGLGRPGQARAHWLEALAIFDRLQLAGAGQVRALLAELPSRRRGRHDQSTGKGATKPR